MSRGPRAKTLVPPRRLAEILQAGWRNLQEGRPGDARRCFKEVLRVDPKNADGLYLLGLAEFTLGRHDKAQRAFRAAANAAPTNPDAFCGLGLACQALGRLDAAIKAFEKAVELRPMFPEALHNLGATYLRSGRVGNAAATLTIAADLWADNPETHFLLGKARARLSEFDEAERRYRTALRIKADHVGALIALGQLPRLLVSMDEAESLLENALRISPEALEALESLAEIFEISDRLDEAKALAARALSIDPHRHRAEITLARVAFHQGDYEAARHRLEKILGRRKIPGELASVAGKILALVLDRMKMPAEAFAALVEANRVRAALQSTKNARPRQAVYDHHLECWRKWTFDGNLAAGEDRARDGRRSPVFFVGFPRSGTTLVERALGSHDRIQTCGETPALTNTMMARGFFRKADCHLQENLSDTDDKEINQIRDIYWREFEKATSLKNPTKLVVDKVPLNIVELGFVQHVFPDSPVIVALRDPRDVCLSCFMQDFETNMANIHFLDLEETAQFYARTMSLWLHYRSTLALRMMSYRYEDLVDDFEGTMRGIVEFLGEPWDGNVLNFARMPYQPHTVTPSHRDIIKPIYNRASGRWRAYEAQLAPILPILQPFIDEFGYR